MTTKKPAKAVEKKSSAKPSAKPPAKLKSAERLAAMESESPSKKQPKPEDLKKITDLADECGKITNYIERGEEAIKKAKARLAEIQTHDLVDLMDEFGIDNLGLPNWDSDINVVTHVHASLPALPAPHKEDYAEKAERRANGLAWLKKDGHDGIITVDVSLAFPKGHQKDATKLAKDLQKQAAAYAKTHDGERPYTVEIGEAVNWKALTSLVKDLVTVKGRTDVPLTDLGASVFRMAKIDKRSERKKS